MSDQACALRTAPPLTQFIMFVLAIFVLVNTGCGSGELSRSQVKSLVENAPDFKQPATVDLTNPYESQSSCTERLSAAETVELAKNRALQNSLESYPDINAARYLGYINVEQTLVKEDKYFPANTFAQPCWGLSVKYRAAAQGKALWEAMKLPVRDEALPTGEKQFGAVSGITKQGDTQAVADFTYQWQPNDLGKALDERSEEFKKMPGEIQKALTEKKGLLHVSESIDWSGERQGKAFFQKYDDGWRLIKIL